MENKFRNKQFGLKRFYNSFKFSWDGLKYAYLNEQSMIIHLFATLVGIILGIVLNISSYEWIALISVLSIIGATELLNTAIEATVDMVTQEYHPLAKIAKDTASAAVFMLSVVGGIVGLIIFVPKIIDILVKL